MVLPIALFAYFLILMDNSIVFTSSVEIGQSLQLTSRSLSWLSNAYTLTFGGFLLLNARLSDLLGRKRVFIVGLVIFGVSSLVIGVSQTASVMIGMRAVQGIGSSIIAPTTLALIMDAYKEKMREKAISYYGATAGIGAGVSLVIGGALTSFVSWRAAFLINVPLVGILLILTIKFIATSKIKKEKIDFTGSLLSVLGIVSFIYGLTERTSLFIILGLLILVLFIIREKKISYPILPLFLFKNRIRAGAYSARFLFMMTMLPFWFFLPQMMQNQYNFSALESGLAFLPLTLVNFLVALQLPKLTAAYGNNRVLLIGEIILALGLLAIAISNPSLGYWQTLFIPMMILGLGQGLILAPVTSAGIYKAPKEYAGIASGVTNTMHQLGGPFGLSLIGSLTTSFHGEIWIMAFFTLVGMMVVATLIVPHSTNTG